MFSEETKKQRRKAVKLNNEGSPEATDAFIRFLNFAVDELDKRAESLEKK